MIYLLLADGFEDTEALCPLDLLRRGGLTVRTVGVTGKLVRSSHGVTVTADILPDEVENDCDLLLLPGGMPGAKNLDESPVTDRLIESAVKRGGRIGAICAAPFILGKRGLLDGKRAVCFPGFEGFLTGATVVKDNVVTDGNITTAIGMGASMEFGLELLALMTDNETSARIGNSIFGK